MAQILHGTQLTAIYYRFANEADRLAIKARENDVGKLGVQYKWMTEASGC